MTTAKQIQIAEELIKSGLVSKVFHSCQIIRDDKNQTLYPAYPRGGEYVYTGIDDSKGLFAYIRENGDMAGFPLKIESCGRSYTMTAPLRIVFFNDNETRDQADLVRRLSAFTFLTNVTLVRVITDKFRLVREESPLFRQSFDGKTFYAAIDVTVTFVLSSSDCATEACIVYKNPVTSCPAAVQTSSESATS